MSRIERGLKRRATVQARFLFRVFRVFRGFSLRIFAGRADESDFHARKYRDGRWSEIGGEASCA
jgi:hypothetical protein